FFYNYTLKKNFENDILDFANKNETQIFKINDITFFSNCDAKNKTSSASNFTIENLYQYTDIAIFLKTNSDLSMQNTLKKVTISNIQFVNLPALGQPKLYFKSLNLFAKSDIIEENEITNNFDFNISSLDEADLSTPTLYNNLANPITLSYVNSNIKTDYTLTDTSSPITYDSSLLKRCNVLLDDISSKLSFDIFITNNLDEEFKTTVYIDIPLSDGGKSIYDGAITKKEKVNYAFYRYK
ncbi:hypothetical protein IKE96_04185, partial [bacterium]|nr:hypothetical protein [bacterium]